MRKLAMDNLQHLPLGYSSLQEIIKHNAAYVDKTHLLTKLVNEGKYYFLSRPRRFGKTLTVDTLKQLFLGNQKLFKGTYAEKHWDWGAQFPVIHFSFGGSKGFESQKALLDIIENTLEEHAKAHDITLPKREFGVQFHALIRALKLKYNQHVVVLVDEYDKPILDVINQTDEAIVNREILKGLYSVIKDNDAYLRFVFVTGVTKFSKVSLFSGLNNLDDIGFMPQYAEICGYTQAELEVYFKDYLQGVDKVKLKQWYNGFNFSGNPDHSVYNPYDILLFFRHNKEFDNYWFRTGTPSFLIKLLKQGQYNVPSFEHCLVSKDMLNNIDINDLPLETVLFQTGYLTIKEKAYIGTQLAFVLTYPNMEVKAALNAEISRIGVESYHNNRNKNNLYQALLKDDWVFFESCIKSLFSAIPHDWYRNNPIQNYEGHYCAVIYSYFTALGMQTAAENATSMGKIDMSIIVPDNKVILFEFKVSHGNNVAKAALQQIIDRDYKQKFLSLNLPIYEIGISFDQDTRSINGFELNRSEA